MLEAYQAPEIDPAIDEALRAFVDQRMAELPDSDY
jgi:trimethylamine:corrinoid methyltransferase-like protein